MTFVVDTNIPIVANGGEWLEKAPECVIICIHQLRGIKEAGRVAVDDSWQILLEYKRYLRETGEPGPGDAFLKWVLSNIRSQKCDFVRVGIFPDDPELAAFDLADRKFVTVAIAHPDHPPVLQATDSKWRNFAGPLARNGVVVQFLCP